ncbi:MAG: N-acetyltransferase [Zymomonas sp.]|nr:MAG: N-acetyltransferase [Zymomonas sp.]
MLTIEKAADTEDFCAAHQLIAEMGAWDAEQTEAHGASSDDMLATYYSDSVPILMTRFGVAGADLFLAREDQETIGCVGFSGHADIAHVFKLYVRAPWRGRGVGGALMTAALEGIQAAGYQRARLVTTRFMPEAISLYRAVGFEDCPSFEAAPGDLQDITVYMERSIARPRDLD